MGNHALRKKLGKILKEKGYGKLYTCPKRQAFKYFKSHRIRSMINFLTKIEIGMKVNEWGINQVVSKLPEPKWFTKRRTSAVTRGGLYGDVTQVEYASGYLGCGCGAFECYQHENAVQTKEEIVQSFKEGFQDINWGPGTIGLVYFELLKKGIDLLTEDGFLVPNYRELMKQVDSTKLREEWHKSIKKDMVNG